MHISIQGLETPETEFSGQSNRNSEIKREYIENKYMEKRD